MDFGIDHRESDQEREHRHKEEEYFLPGRLLQFVLQVPEKRSEEHTSELSHKPISYAVFCLKKKKKKKKNTTT